MNKPYTKHTFEYTANKARVSKEASHTILKGLMLGIMTGLAIAVILFFFLVPTAALLFDDWSTGVSTIVILIAMVLVGVISYLVVKSGINNRG